MDTAESIAQLVKPRRPHRSSVSNGTKLFAVEGLDGRTHTARRFRDLVEAMMLDLGGFDLLSEGEKQLIRRAAGLAVMSEGAEAALVRDMAVDIDQYGQMTDRLGRCLQRLGLKRVPRTVDEPSFYEITADIYADKASRVTETSDGEAPGPRVEPAGAFDGPSPPTPTTGTGIPGRPRRSL